MSFYAGYFVATVSEITTKLSRDLARHGQAAGLVVVVFAHGDKPWVQEHILPLVEFWNYRSAKHVTIFFVGYTGDVENGESEYSAIGDVRFSAKAFNEAIESFEKHTEWRYLGDTPIVIMRASLVDEEGEESKGHAVLDREVIAFELEAALRDGVVASVEKLFEKIVHTARSVPGANAQWKLSDRLGSSSLGDAILDSLASLDASGIKKALKATCFFRVRTV